MTSPCPTIFLKSKQNKQSTKSASLDDQTPLRRTRQTLILPRLRREIPIEQIPLPHPARQIHRPVTLIRPPLSLAWVWEQQPALAAIQRQLVQRLVLDVGRGHEVRCRVALVAARAGEVPDGGALGVVGIVRAPGVLTLVADGEGPLAWEAAGEGGQVGQGAVGEEVDHGGGEGFVFGGGDGDGAGRVPGAGGTFGWALGVFSR